MVIWLAAPSAAAIIPRFACKVRGLLFCQMTIAVARMKTLMQIYDARAALGHIRPDDAQRAILPMLNDLRTALHAAASPARRLGRAAQRLAGGPDTPPPKGLYIWGDVGRGKSMLMDLLFENLNISGKRRVHFHAFLQELHGAIHAARRAGAPDPIEAALMQASAGLRVLALDEMDVSDIADAMILDRTLRHFLGCGVCVMTTSNRPPDQLYRNGLKRELFTPFIDLLQSRLDVVPLSSPTDWRRMGAAAVPVFFRMDGAQFDQLWHSATAGHIQPLTISLLGRQLMFADAGNGCVKASFAQLCDAALGPADYRCMMQSVRVLFLDDVPLLGAGAQDKIRRFVTLIDEAYEARLGLVMRSAAAPDALIAADMQSSGTNRLTSRLAQMQSADWVGAYVLPVVQRG